MAAEPNLDLEVLAGNVAVCRADNSDAGRQILSEAVATMLRENDSPPALWSLTVTPEEVSLVCDEAAAPSQMRSECGWSALKVAGVLDFSLVGILASLTEVLAQAELSVFALSTFDTDYLLVRTEALPDAVGALRCAGYTVRVTQDS